MDEDKHARTLQGLKYLLVFLPLIVKDLVGVLADKPPFIPRSLDALLVSSIAATGLEKGSFARAMNLSGYLEVTSANPSFIALVSLDADS